MRKTLHIVFGIVLGMTLCAICLQAQTSQTNDTQKEGTNTATRPVGAYKLDYSIFEVEGSKRVNSRNYVVLVTDDGRDASLRTGSRVPVLAKGSDSSWQYVDVGVNISSNLFWHHAGGGMVLASIVEADSIAPEQKEQGSVPATPIIRTLRTRSYNSPVLGKPILIGSMDDAASNRRYEVEVIVTKQ